MPLLHFRCNAAVLVGRKTLGVAILFRIARPDPRPFPERLILHDAWNDRRLRPELNVCWRDVWRHHTNQIVIVQETVEKAAQPLSDVSCPFEPHMRCVEKHDKRTSRIDGMPQVLDFLRCSIFDDRDVGGRQVLTRRGVQRRVKVEPDHGGRDGLRVGGCGGNLRSGCRRHEGECQEREVPTSAHSSYTAEVSSECKTGWAKSQMPNPKSQIPKPRDVTKNWDLRLGIWDLGFPR